MTLHLLDQLAAHIPGSGVNFNAVGELRIVEKAAIKRAPFPLAKREGIRLAAGERLLLVSGRFAVGDIVIVLREDSMQTSLGRPMQVLSAGAESALVLDDPSLGRSRTPDIEVSAALHLGSFDASIVWDVLAAWGIHRCPRCRAPGLAVVYGMASGPPAPGWTLGGCVVTVIQGDLRCSRCAMHWRTPAAERLSA